MGRYKAVIAFVLAVGGGLVGTSIIYRWGPREGAGDCSLMWKGGAAAGGGGLCSLLWKGGTAAGGGGLLASFGKEVPPHPARPMFFLRFFPQAFDKAFR